MKKEHLDKLRPLFLRQRNLENIKISLAKFDGITTGEEFFGDIAAPLGASNGGAGAHCHLEIVAAMTPL
jgi:hypothetical protein